MADLGCVYECDRCAGRIDAPGPIFDKSLCPRPAEGGGRCLGHLRRIEPETPDRDVPSD